MSSLEVVISPTLITHALCKVSGNVPKLLKLLLHLLPVIKRRWLISSENDVVLIVEYSVTLTNWDDHIAEVVGVRNPERSHSLTGVGLKIVLGGLHMIVANSGISVVLSRLFTIHFKYLDLSVVWIIVKSVVDDCEVAVVLVVLEHQPWGAVIDLALFEVRGH